MRENERISGLLGKKWLLCFVRTHTKNDNQNVGLVGHTCEGATGWVE